MNLRSKRQWLPAEALGNGKGMVVVSTKQFDQSMQTHRFSVGAVEGEAPRAVEGAKKGKAKAKEGEEGSEGMEEEEGSDVEGESDEELRRREKAPEYLDEDAPLGDQIGE